MQRSSACVQRQLPIRIKPTRKRHSEFTKRLWRWVDSVNHAIARNAACGAGQATVKGNYKRHWISPDPIGEASGIPAGFYFLPSDTREKTPMLVNLIHLKSPFNRMRLRHELWKKEYPDLPERHGIPWQGIENATPEIQAMANPALDLENLPFDPLEYVEHLDELPFDPNTDPGLGNSQ